MSETQTPALITAEHAERIRAKTISNILKRISKGGTPTAAESKMLEEATAPRVADLRTATCSVHDLAELTGYTTQRLDQLRADGIVVQKSRGIYDLWASVQNLFGHVKSRKLNQWDSGDAEDAQGYEVHRSRLTAAKADIAEIEAGLRKNQVHDAGAVMAVWSDMITNAKTKLLALPTKCAGLIHGEESLDCIRSVLEEAVSLALTELAEYDPSLATDRYLQSHSGSVETAAEVEDEPVVGPPEKAVKRGKRRARSVEHGEG